MSEADLIARLKAKFLEADPTRVTVGLLPSDFMDLCDRLSTLDRENSDLRKANDKLKETLLQASEDLSNSIAADLKLRMRLEYELRFAKAKFDLLNEFYTCNADEEPDEKLAANTKRMIEENISLKARVAELEQKERMERTHGGE